jgi:hypothetical protein
VPPRPLNHAHSRPQITWCRSPTKSNFDAVFSVALSGYISEPTCVTPSDPKAPLAEAVSLIDECVESYPNQSSHIFERLSERRSRLVASVVAGARPPARTCANLTPPSSDVHRRQRKDQRLTGNPPPSRSAHHAPADAGPDDLSGSTK